MALVIPIFKTSDNQGANLCQRTNKVERVVVKVANKVAASKVVNRVAGAASKAAKVVNRVVRAANRAAASAL
jgi:hypothetical protein